jgi:hypothetical protein
MGDKTEQVEIKCRCENCTHFEYENVGYGYCYYWKYELGESPNQVYMNDFCSNAEE